MMIPGTLLLQQYTFIFDQKKQKQNYATSCLSKHKASVDGHKQMHILCSQISKYHYLG